MEVAENLRGSLEGVIEKINKDLQNGSIFEIDASIRSMSKRLRDEEKHDDEK